MAKVKNDYFKMIEQQVSYCVDAARLLEQIMCNFSVDSISEQRNQMHEIEHMADEIHHDILTKLTTEFITPIDQEDILQLVQIIDDITDALDEVVLECYIYYINDVPESAADLAKVVNRCVNALAEAAGELKNFKKPDRLRSLLIKVNDIENDADAIFIEAMHKLFGSTNDGKILLSSKALYESLEQCCDLCEHAADAIEHVVIKNS